MNQGSVVLFQPCISLVYTSPLGRNRRSAKPNCLSTEQVLVLNLQPVVKIYLGDFYEEQYPHAIGINISDDRHGRGGLFARAQARRPIYADTGLQGLI